MAARRKGRDQRGQAAVFLVLAMGIFLIGGVGFVVDGANLWFHRQSSQTAADAACEAAAMDLLSHASGVTPPDPNWIANGTTPFLCSGSMDSGGGDSQPNSGLPPCAYASLNGYSGSALQNVQVQLFAANSLNPPLVPACSGYSLQVCRADDIAATPYVEVDLTDNVPMTFIRMLGAGPTAGVAARARCGLSNVLSAVPILVLNPNQGDALTAIAPASLTVVNGPPTSIEVDSAASDAVDAGNITIDLTQANHGNGGEFAVASRETGSWVSAAGTMSDPFALIPSPSAPGAVGFHDTTCPFGIPASNCQHYYPGQYSSGITVPNGYIAVFEPGLYYLTGDFVAGPNTCIRPDTTFPNTEGTVFYFDGGSTLTVHGSSGTASAGTFDCASTPVPISAIQCSGSNNPLLSDLPPAGLTGNVLLAPCQAPTGDPLQPYGDPLGAADPQGEQRGILFFHDRDSAPVTPPEWHSAGSFGLIGHVYLHDCHSTSSAGSGANCSPNAFSDVFRMGSARPAYIVGNVVVDRMELGEAAGTTSITVSLNPSPQYYILKASLLQ